MKNSRMKRHQQSWSKMLSQMSPPLSKQRSLTYNMLYRQKILQPDTPPSNVSSHTRRHHHPLLHVGCITPHVDAPTYQDHRVTDRMVNMLLASKALTRW